MQIVNLKNPHSGAILTAFIVNSLSEIRPEFKRDGALFIQAADGALYQWYDTDGTMRGIGGFFGKIMGIAAPFANLIPGVGQFVSAGLGVASSLIAGTPGQARGLQQITDFGNKILSAFDTLAGQLTPQNAIQIATEADKLVALLEDSNAVYQAKKGKDAEALASFKAQAQQRAAQLKAAAAELARQTPVSTGNPQANQNANSGDSQIPTGVFYAVGGIAAFYFLTRFLK